MEFPVSPKIKALTCFLFSLHHDYITQTLRHSTISSAIVMLFLVLTLYKRLQYWVKYSVTLIIGYSVDLVEKFKNYNEGFAWKLL